MKKGGMSEAHKQKIREAQALRKQRREQGDTSSYAKNKPLPKIEGKPVLYLTGREKWANDMFTAIRESLRPLGRNIECKQLCMKLANSTDAHSPKNLLPLLRETFEIKRKPE
jgi:hypothetical protein